MSPRLLKRVKYRNASHLIVSDEYYFRKDNFKLLTSIILSKTQITVVNKLDYTFVI
jgi:hypothetical protein